MAKTAKPAIQKLKEQILNDLTPEDQVELGEWYNNILAVREAYAAAARRRAATAQETASNKTTIVGGASTREAGRDAGSAL